MWIGGPGAGPAGKGVGTDRFAFLIGNCQTWGNRNVISSRLQLITFFSVIVIVIDY